MADELAATIALPTADIPGFGSRGGPLAGSISLPVAAIAGDAYPAGGLAGTLSLPTAAIAGRTAATGPLVGTISLPRGALSGGIVASGPMAATISMPAGRLSDGPVGAVAGTISLPTGAVSAWAGTAAAGLWLHLETSPVAQVYSLDAIRGRLNPYLPMHRADFTVSPLQAQVGRQNESWSLTLTGAGADLRSRIAAQALYGVRVRLYDGGDLLRDGVTDGLTNRGRTLELTVQADAWTTDLPIRTTADVGTFRDVEQIAWRYGRNVPGVLIPLSNTRKRWIWADHAVSAIRSVTLDGVPYGAWSWRNTIDGNGYPIAIVETVDAIDDGELVATGDGAMDLQSGALLSNPADILLDICTKAGRTVSRGTLARFRRDCLARNLELSHSIDGGTLQAACESIAASVYAVFARSHREMFRLLPITAAVDGVLPAKDLGAVVGDGDSIATRLLVRYGTEENGPRRSLEVRAPGVELAHGERSAEVALEWVREDRTAADVATRILQDRARPSFVFPYTNQLRVWTPGETATVSDPSLGLSGSALVESCNGAAVSARLRVGALPVVALASLASAFSPETYASGTVTQQGSERIITILDPSNRPIVGARCTLDGGITRTSDGAGRVSFPASIMGPGTHTIDVIADGYEPFRLTVTL